MQLTNSLALLFAVAYSAPSAFALPISSDSDINARDLPFELDARQVEDLQLTARDLIERYREAREFFDGLDARSFNEPEYESREFEDYLFARTDVTTLNQQIRDEIKKLEADKDLRTHAGTDPVLAKLLTLWADEAKLAPSPTPKQDPATLAKRQARKARLTTIAGKKYSDQAFHVAVGTEMAYLLFKYTPFGTDPKFPVPDPALKGLTLDPKLLVALPGSYIAAHAQETMFVSFAQDKNEILYLLNEIKHSTAGSTDIFGRRHAQANPYQPKAAEELKRKDDHINDLKAQKPAAKAQSQVWIADLEQIKQGKDPKKLVSEAKEHVQRLRIIAENKGDAAFTAAVAAEDAYRQKQQAASGQPALSVTTNGQTPPPVIGGQPATPVGAAPVNGQKKLRRRRFN